MKKYNFISNKTRASLALALGLAMASCNDSDFSSKTPELSKTHEIIDLNTEGSSDPYILNVGDKDKLEIFLKRAGNKSIGGEEIINLAPVDMIIALDVTASMSEEITEVKESILKVVETLKTENIDLSVGMVTFVDTKLDPWLSPQYDQMVTKLTSDTNFFVNKLENLSLAVPNSDFPEAGLWAIQHSIELLRTNSRPDAMKVVLAITDAQLHNGQAEGAAVDSPPVRDCSIDKTVNSFESYANNLGNDDKIKFFYAAPTNVVSNYNTCSDGQLNPRSQLEAIFSRILPSITPEKKGGHLKDSRGRDLWPMTGGEFSNSLISMIKSTTNKPTTALQCYVESAELLKDGVIIKDFKAEKVSDLGQATADTLLFSPKIDLNQILGQANEVNLDMSIERCCIEPSETSFSQCKSRTSQSIPIQIIAR